MPRVRLALLLLTLSADTTSWCGTLAFRPSTRLACMILNRRTSAPHVVVSLSKKSSEGNFRKSRIRPFLARALQKLRNKREDGKSRGVDGGAIVENSDQVEKGNVESEAALLRALAEKTRLEADKMDLELTLSKINKLEEKISETDELPNVLVEAELLMKKINALRHVSETDELSNVLVQAESLMKKINALEYVTDGVSLSTEQMSKELSSAKRPSSGDEIQNASKSKQEEETNVVKEILDGVNASLSGDGRQDEIIGFGKLPQQIKDMMAETAGMKRGANATLVVGKLMEENMRFEGDGNEKKLGIAKAEELEDVLINLETAEIDSFVQSLLPGVTRKEPVKEEYIDAFYSEILGKDTFNPRERKPQAVPGGYLFRGDNKVQTEKGKDYGDVLIEALDEKMSNSSVAGKVQAYYILDPTPPSGEEILNDEDETPVMLITNYDISPNTQPWVKPAVTFLSLVSIITFALTCFSFNEDVLDRISASADSGDENFDFLYDLSFPLAFSVLAIQLIHEAGHLMIAFKDGIQIGLPTFVPGFQFGITGGITPIKSPPKNIKSLFDFAIVGPTFGLLASVILLYLGLELTAFMDASSQQQLPSVPIQILRSSALAGGMIEYLLGDGILNSPNPASDLIKLHPYVIAGFGGLVVNALSLLPIGNTDGGRICVAFFGRSFSRVVQSTAILVLVIAGLLGADKANILLCYAIYCQFWQNEAEVPCRNEVDELDSTRGIIAIAMSLIVILTLIPVAD